MKIALDYDNTYTLDPDGWNIFIETMISRGHEIYIVTHRHYELDKIPHDIKIHIIYTNGVAKKLYTWAFHGVEIDVWIDDKPETVFENSKATKEWLEEWRATRNV